MNLCDLHAHSDYSDGTLSPRALLLLAQQQGLGALALCDHNTVAGLPDFLEAGKASGVETVPGIEFSTDYGATELHILMLFAEPRDYDVITRRVEQLRINKEISNRETVQALKADGIVIDYEALCRRAPDGYINRAHIAAELTRLGYTGSIQEAFGSYLSAKGKYFKPPKRLDVFETIRFIKQLGGVAVLAHPFLNLDEVSLREFLPLAKECGLDGMETMYAKYDGTTTQKAKVLAAQFDLLESGGSDFHGENKPDIHLGTGRGDLQISMEYYHRLKERKREKTT